MSHPWWPPLAWMAVIFWFSAQPNLPRLEKNVLDFLMKKSAHALEYAILAGLLWRAAVRTRPEVRTTLWVILALWVATVAYAASDEFHQAFVPGRTPSARDVLIDALGAASTLALVAWQARRIVGRAAGGDI